MNINDRAKLIQDALVKASQTNVAKADPRLVAAIQDASRANNQNPVDVLSDAIKKAKAELTK